VKNLWPTPTRDDATHNGRDLDHRIKKGSQMGLVDMVRLNPIGLFQAVFPVRIFQSQERGREYMEKGQVFGLNIGELLTIYDHDSQSWKMSECLFTGDYGKYSEALPRSGIMLNGKIYEQATWVRRTGGKESGLLPTPIKERAGTSEKTLQMVREGKAHMTLDRYMQMFPTSTTRDWKDGTAKSCENVPVNGLLGRAIHSPTPRATKIEGYSRGDFRPALHQVASGEDKPVAGSLNPTWVDWLMGYPIEWTDLEASEMQLSLK